MKMLLLAGTTLLALSASVVTASAVPITFTSLDVPKAIPDNNPVGITSTLNVAGIGAISDVNLIFNNLQHTSVADLHIELRSPTGTQIPLVLAFTENGILTGLGTPDNFIGTVFDDQAATNLAAGTAPYTGAFNVNHPSVGNAPLAGFNGLNATGVWTLFVSDRAVADVGTLNSWSLQIDGAATGVPEPASLALLGAGLFGLGLLRRKRA